MEGFERVTRVGRELELRADGGSGKMREERVWEMCLGAELKTYVSEGGGREQTLAFSSSIDLRMSSACGLEVHQKIIINSRKMKWNREVKRIFRTFGATTDLPQYVCSISCYE